MENSKLLFRASAASRLMSEPKLKADKEAGKLSQTSKSYLKELYLEREFGFKEDFISYETLKGNLNEQDSFSLVQKVLGGEFRIKNQENFPNDLFSGTPDIILKNEDFVEDVKTSWTLKTFFNAGDLDSEDERKINKSYYYQALVYMALTGKKNYRLIYCLTNTPERIVTDLKKRLYYRFDCDEENKDYQEMSIQIELNHNYDRIPLEKRIKIIEFPFSVEEYSKLESQAYKALEYYKTLSL
jgi:hypothetical protein